MISLLKDHKFFPREQPSRKQPSQPSQVPKKNILPLKELYLDDKHYDNELEISWVTGDKLSIKSQKSPIFGPFDIRSNGKLLTVSYSHVLRIRLLT